MKELTTIKAPTTVYTALKAVLTVYEPHFLKMLLKHGVFKYIFFLKIIMKPLKKNQKKKPKTLFISN